MPRLSLAKTNHPHFGRMDDLPQTRLGCDANSLFGCGNLAFGCFLSAGHKLNERPDALGLARLIGLFGGPIEYRLF
jgi:hypothetical protein